jgi:hypothetical protein
MKKNKDLMTANLSEIKEDGNLTLIDIPTLQNGFSSNFEIFRNLFPNGLFDESCTNLDLNLTIPNRTRAGKTLEAKAKDALEVEVRETFKSSGLLNDPSKKDDWFYAIDDMTRDFHDKFQKLPNFTQAWVVLCSSPPESYGISKGTHLNEDCIFICESNPLSKSAFAKRWKKYTSK